ncbi:histidine kinase [Herbaspirillum sp. BH-1]|uniref:histidine kinase n=1 Tax=Herbaspirillum frisingense TaxID=92645 RepID=A0ABU1PJ48_9BURK|nr:MULTISPECIES: ATP-binding protein [Herbaspirillum]MDR6585968.1 signal transduction histidine kinase/ActR/RegA family two-component response regulator [Herbaspirillum frisingense]PLY61123.1 histidine kinase [Herbaspirillum sp. BH-1]
MTLRLLTVAIGNEIDVVGARQRARQIAELCGFAQQDQVRIATSISELARNAFRYAGRGQVEFAIEGSTAPQTLLMCVRDQGPGIADLELVLSGRYQSNTGMGLGLTGARKLMDAFDIETAPGKGTTVQMRKLLPPAARLITPRVAGEIGSALAATPAGLALFETQQQNQELLATLAELKGRQEELLQLTRELEDTNRGVVALYAELDEKADHLRRADEAKSRFLSNMSHEFRTPLSSIRALAKLLLDRVDGELGTEQERQVRYILDSAGALSELVNDLLDLAKIEAGKVEIQPSRFQVAELFSALRGMLRPLLVSDRLRLSFVAPDECEMFTDEGKLSQILRNFISNAIKFTEQGSITVTAEPLRDGTVRFSVTDTGIGIPPQHLGIIFEEFSQVENHLQRHVKGTGLGLPLCRQLAMLLGGEVAVASQQGQGSTFSAVIPVIHAGTGALPDGPTLALHERPEPSAASLPVLVVEDRPELRLLYQRYLHQSEFRVVPASSVAEAEALWRNGEPCAVVLDILLDGKDSWHWLVQLKNDPERCDVPVIIASDVDDKSKAMGLGADAYFLKPVGRDELLAALRSLVQLPPHRNEIALGEVNA